MEVVATQKGFFGGKIRQRGDQFTVATKGEVSKNWMTSASGVEGKAILREVGGGLSDAAKEATIAAEQAAATERAGDVAKAELAKAEAENQELRDRITALEAAATDTGGATSETPDGSDDTGGATPPPGEAGTTEPPPTERKSRRRRNAG